ncbi:MAG TPA: PAS domain S-box protein [Blastocatellia bacterium]|nr:PAS domain S-box protein [Blastocatellia bacterium]
MHPVRENYKAALVVVSGDPVRLREINACLRPRGFEVTPVPGNDSALHLFRTALPDLVISDLSTEGIDGAELCREIKSNPSTAAIPVLLCCAPGSNDAVIRSAFEAGADDCVLIDAPGELLARRVERLLSAREERQARALAEEALRASEERYKHLFEANPTPMWVYDLDTLLILAVNEAAIANYGYSRDEFLSLTIAQIRPARDVDRLLERLRGSTTGFLHRQSWTHRRKDGSDILVEVSSHDLSLSFLGRRARLVLANDVTERRKAENALRESEERFAKAFNANPNPMAIHMLEDGRYIDVNHSFLAVTGFTREEVLGRNADEVNMVVDQQERAGWTKTLHELGGFRGVEIQFRIKSGEVRTGLLSAEVVEVGGTRCVLSVTEDITERKQLTEQLMHSQKMDAIGRLAGGIAHDFNNLLTAIIGHSQLLKMRLGEEAKSYPDAAEIERAARRAASLTGQLLAISRKQISQPRVLDLNAVVMDMRSLLSRLVGEDITLDTSLDPVLWNVKTDPSQIEQVIMNLAVNARDAMPGGGVLTIETKNAELGAEYVRGHADTGIGQYVMLAVTDTGCGMDKQTQARVFEPFFTTKDAGKGTGLGLSTSYGIVKQNGGNILVYSELGYGTIFKVYLPRAAEQAEQVVLQDRGPVAAGTETVLLVEDEDIVRGLVIEVLRTVGYTVLEASNGREAMEMAAAYDGDIHLLLTDAVMPEMGGPELMEGMRRARPGIRTLLMSGYTGESRGRNGLTPPVGLLQKPFSPVDLCRKVRGVLDSPVPS